MNSHVPGQNPKPAQRHESLVSWAAVGVWLIKSMMVGCGHLEHV